MFKNISIRLRIIFLLLFIFTSLGFAQLTKPSNQSITILSDSLRLKYLYADSSNVMSNYFMRNDTSNGGNHTSYLNDIFLGDSVFNNYGNGISTLNDNIGIGSNAGAQNYATESPSDYTHNYYLGSYAGSNDYGYLQTGSQTGNIGIGYSAWRNTQGSYANISIGYYSGYSTSNSANSIFIGTQAGYNGGGTGTNIIGYSSTLPTGGDYNNYIGYNTAQNSNGNYNNYFGYQCGTSGIVQSNSHCIIIGTNPYEFASPLIGQLLISDNTYYPGSDFITGDMPNANFLIKGKISIDSSGQTLNYHTTPLTVNRTAGIDSLKAGIDTIRTTAYSANSLVFITNLSIGTGLVYVNKANSLAGSYFVVTSTILTDTNKFNWFILKTY